MAGMGRLDKTSDGDVLIFPIIQAGQFGIREEERALSMLFSHLSQQHSRKDDQHDDGPLMDLTSGYFGLYKDYRELVLQANLRCRILAASPKVRTGCSNFLTSIGSLEPLV